MIVSEITIYNDTVSYDRRKRIRAAGMGWYGKRIQ